MTVSTTSSGNIFLGTGSLSVFTYNFIMGAASNAVLYYVNAQGVQTPLTSSQYTLTINAPATGALWGIGGTVTYLNGGLPIGAGTQLIVDRLLPLTQTTSISNQGDFAPQVIEQALDILCFEIQQISARTGQIRGVWATDIDYNFGDIVQDGINGASTFNLYVCALPNTSGVWATDLANGDWSLALNVQNLIVVGSYLPITGGTILGNLTVNGTTNLIGALTLNTPLVVAQGGTGSSTASGARTNLGLGTAATQNTGISGATLPFLNGNNIFSGTNNFTNGIQVNSALGTTTAGDVNITGNYKINGTVQATPINQAWVNFTGSTGAVVASGGIGSLIGSITRNSAGDYTVNFSTSRVDANYCIFSNAVAESTRPITVNIKNGTTPTPTSCHLIAFDTANTATDPTSVYVSIIGN